MLRTFIHQRYLIMLAKLLRSVAIGFIVGGILLAAMPSLRKWTTTTTTLTSSDESPASYNQAVRRAAKRKFSVSKKHKLEYE